MYDEGVTANAVSVRALVPILIAMTVMQMPVYLTGALAVSIRHEISLSAGTFGLSVSFFFIISSVGSAAMGIFADRIGWSRALIAGALGAGVSLLGIGVLATSWLSLGLLLAVGGLAHALGQPAANLALARLVGAGRQGLVLGIKQAAIPFATLLAGLAVPVAAFVFGWRTVFAVVAVFGAASAVLIPRRYEQRQSYEVRQRLASGRRSPVRPLALVSLAGGLGAMVGTSIGAFLVTSAVSSGMAVHQAGLLLSIGSIAGLLVRVGAGWASDRWPIRPLRLAALLLAVGAMGCVLLSSGNRLALLVGAILAFGAGWGWPGLFHLAIVRGYTSSPARATGIVQTGVYMGAAAGPLAFGFLADDQGYAFAWVAISVIALVAASLTVMSERSSRRDAPVGVLLD